MKYILLLILSFCLNFHVKSQQNLAGVGFSYSYTYVTNLTIEKYIPVTTKGKAVVSNKNVTPRISYGLKYGKVLSPKFIFFTGIEKVGYGQSFNVELTEFVVGYSTTSTETTVYDLDLNLQYLKIPLGLYWKHFKDHKFGTYLSLSFDFGMLTSAKLEQNGVKKDYKSEFNSFDVNYKLGFGARYDHEKYLVTFGLAFGDGLSDIENKDKFGKSIPEPTIIHFIGYFASYNFKF